MVNQLKNLSTIKHCKNFEIDNKSNINIHLDTLKNIYDNDCKNWKEKPKITLIQVTARDRKWEGSCMPSSGLILSSKVKMMKRKAGRIWWRMMW